MVKTRRDFVERQAQVVVGVGLEVARCCSNTSSLTFRGVHDERDALGVLVPPPRRLHTEKPEVSGSSARKKMMSGAA